MKRLHGPLAIAAAVLLGCGPAEREEIDPAIAPVAAELTDAEIAHVLTTANEADIEAGRLALERSRNEEVRGFAQRMITEHQAANDTLRQHAVRLGLSPVENEMSRTLRAQAEVERDRLRAAADEAFDRDYIEHEVNFHAQLLESIDDVLQPAAATGELRDLLGAMRSTVESHLEHARRLHGGQQP